MRDIESGKATPQPCRGLCQSRWSLQRLCTSGSVGTASRLAQPTKTARLEPLPRSRYQRERSKSAPKSESFDGATVGQGPRTKPAVGHQRAPYGPESDRPTDRHTLRDSSQLATLRVGSSFPVYSLPPSQHHPEFRGKSGIQGVFLNQAVGEPPQAGDAATASPRPSGRAVGVVHMSRRRLWTTPSWFLFLLLFFFVDKFVLRKQ